ncbi:MAG: pyridoxal-phosphate dependent enzyme, partial [Methylibium sp.]
MTPTPSVWHWLDARLSRVRPHRERLALLIDAAVIAVCWQFTNLFRLGFERWFSARPGYDGWVLLGIVVLYVAVFLVLQRTGSFKFRGALNFILQLDAEQKKRGIVAWSSGNHAQGAA